MVASKHPEPEDFLPRAMPPANFSAAFASPSLRWASKKRLRHLHPQHSPASDEDPLPISASDSGCRRLLRSDFPAEAENNQKKKKICRVELWISLSRDEIEEDFLWMTGSRPPRKSRKKERSSFDNLLAAIFPGTWMPNKISAARYRVPEPPRKAARRELSSGIVSPTDLSSDPDALGNGN